MRNSVSLFALALLLASFGSAQTTSGYSQLLLYPGTYASPYVPQLSTPQVQFAPPTLQVGATNATSGNMAGAANSTTETLNPGPAGTAEIDLLSGSSRGGRAWLELGGAILPDSVGVATLMAGQRNQAHSTRTYTNADIDRLKGEGEK